MAETSMGDDNVEIQEILTLLNKKGIKTNQLAHLINGANSTERARGFSDPHIPSRMERFSSYGIELGTNDDGFTSAFYIAQPTALLWGYVILYITTLLIIIIAIIFVASDNADLVTSVPFLTISFVLPFIILPVSFAFQYGQNKSDDNKFEKRINNNKILSNADDTNRT